MSTKGLYVEKRPCFIECHMKMKIKPLQMDHYASGKIQGFKSANCFWILQVQQKYKDKLLRDESYLDKVSGFPVAESSIDSRKYPIF